MNRGLQAHFRRSTPALSGPLLPMRITTAHFLHPRPLLPTAS